MIEFGDVGEEKIIHCDNLQCDKKIQEYETSTHEMIWDYNWVTGVIKVNNFDFIAAHFCSGSCHQEYLDVRNELSEKLCAVIGHYWRVIKQDIIYVYKQKNHQQETLGECRRCGIKKELSVSFSINGEMKS